MPGGKEMLRTWPAGGSWPDLSHLSFEGAEHVVARSECILQGKGSVLATKRRGQLKHKAKALS